MQCSTSLTHVGLTQRALETSRTDVPPIQTLINSLRSPHPPTLRTQSQTAAAEHGNVSHSVEVRPSPGKDFGLFAVDRIPAYSRIIEDNALLSLAQGEDLPQLWEKCCLLPDELKQDFDSLSLPAEYRARAGALVEKLGQRGYSESQANKMTTVSFRFQANAFKTATIAKDPVAARASGNNDPGWAYSLFAKVARINHSCTPNAHAHYRSSSGSQLAYALRDIEPGEEIEISYFDITMPRSDRQLRAASWNFTCKCPACSMKETKFKDTKYEQRIRRIHQHSSAEQQSTARPGLNISSATRDVREAILLAQDSEYPWLVAALPSLHVALFKLLQNNEEAKAQQREALEKMLEWQEKLTGVGSHISENVGMQLSAFDAGIPIAYP